MATWGMAGMEEAETAAVASARGCGGDSCRGCPGRAEILTLLVLMDLGVSPTLLLLPPRPAKGAYKEEEEKEDVAVVAATKGGGLLNRGMAGAPLEPPSAVSSCLTRPCNRLP